MSDGLILSVHDLRKVYRVGEVDVHAPRHALSNSAIAAFV